ncbi:MAG: Holliday junction branch migration protein RuvA [Acetobacteraceae bacterium]
MIAQLTGRVDALADGSCIVDVNGVGYLVLASTRTLAALPQPPAIAKLLVETHVREDAILLYGFIDTAERDWFRLLTTVQGVGGKVALSVLSALSPRDLVGAIAAGDKTSLTRAPGVGARLAARLVTELRDKAGAMPSSSGPGLPAVAVPIGGPTDDAISALVNLGYRRPEAQQAVARASERLGDGASLDALIRDALREMAQRLTG